MCIRDRATRKQESLRTKAAEARTHNNEAKAESYEKEAAKWAENGINRIALHGIVGALVSKEAGTGVEKGLTGAGLNAALQGALKNISDPQSRQSGDRSGSCRRNRFCHCRIRHRIQLALPSAAGNAGQTDQRSRSGRRYG